MHEYRSPGKVDNVADLMSYLDEEGYLNLANQPDFALAVLQLAETTRMKDLYLQALAHCVGMREMLPNRPDFHVSLLNPLTMYCCFRRWYNLEHVTDKLAIECQFIKPKADSQTRQRGESSPRKDV